MCFAGLALIEQWDDVIRSQRRYGSYWLMTFSYSSVCDRCRFHMIALLLWPDVRPAPLMTCTEKLTVMKWSALFNLTLTNIRSFARLCLSLVWNTEWEYSSGQVWACLSCTPLFAPEMSPLWGRSASIHMLDECTDHGPILQVPGTLAPRAIGWGGFTERHPCIDWSKGSRFLSDYVR